MNNNKIKNNKINDDNNIKLIKINKKSNKNSDNNVNKNSDNNVNKNSNNNVNKNSNKNTNNIDNNKKISYKITETNYERPVMTYTDKLSKSQIQELLIDYEQIYYENSDSIFIFGRLNLRETHGLQAPSQ